MGKSLCRSELQCAILGAVVTLIAAFNLGPPAHATNAAHAVVQSGGARPISVLYAPGWDDDPDYRAELAALLGGTVDYFDARSATPSLAQLTSYTAVLTWASRLPYADAAAFGHVLADYVDQGGRVILGENCRSSTGLQGRMMDDPGYCPVLECGLMCFGDYNNDGNHCVHHGPFGDITTYSAEASASVSSLAPGAITDGTFNVPGNPPAVICRPDTLVWYSPGNRGGEGTGQWIQLTAHEIVCGAGDHGACCDPDTYVDPGHPWLGGVCTDDVSFGDCTAIDGQFFYNQACAEQPYICGNPGACCDDTPGYPGQCETTLEALCTAWRFEVGMACEELNPECGLWRPGLLYAPAYRDNPTFRSQIEELLGWQVDYFHAYASVPTLDELLPYAAVMTWVGYPYAYWDAEAMGDVLADYVDAGGRVILGQGTSHTDPIIDWLSGRIMTPQYLPVMCLGVAPGTWAGDSAGCAFDGSAGSVTALTAWADNIRGLQPGALSAGTFTESGLPALAFWPQMSVFYSPGNIGGESGSTGDWAILTANIVACVPVAGACCDASLAMCTDVLPSACQGYHFYPEKLCSDLHPPCGGPPGCCCDDETGLTSCVYQWQCHGAFAAFACDTPLCGDLDMNEIVDLDDYSMFVDAFGRCAGQPGFLPAADFDGDRCVTLVDFQIWRDCYEGARSASCTSADLTPACGDWIPSGLLYAPTENDASEFRAAVAALIGARVDYFDARTHTPTVAQMAGYAAVLVWIGGLPHDGIAYGNNLADYVDRGGKVILGNLNSYSFAICLKGRIMTPEYCPADGIGVRNQSYRGDCLDCATVLFPVEILQSSNCDMLTYLSPGATGCGTLTGGGYALAWRPDKRVYRSAGLRGDASTGKDWPALVANMFLCPVEPLTGACCDLLEQPGPGAPGACQDAVVVSNCLPPDVFYPQQTCAGLDPPCGDPGACCDDDALPPVCTDGVLKANCAARAEGGVLCADLEQMTGWACGDYHACPHRIDLVDYHGPWSGPTLDVYVRDELVLDRIACTDVDGFESQYFLAASGEQIRTVYHPAGLFPDEPYYRIYRPNGHLIIQDGDGASLPTGVTVPGNCEPVYGACCDDAAAACTDQVQEPDCTLRFAAGVQCADFEQATGFACGEYPGCMHRVELYEARGEGWSGHTLDLYVDGLKVLEGLMLLDGSGPATFRFPAETGSVIHTVYHGDGGYAFPYYDICDADGRLLIRDGSDSVPPTGVITPGNCDPMFGACCDDLTGVCVDNELDLNCTHRFAASTACASLLPPCGTLCEHRIDLYDHAGDGWNGNTLDVYLDGTLILDEITLPSGHGPLTFTFTIATGSEIHTVFNAVGSWPSEAYYQIRDDNGALIVQDGGSYGAPTGVTVDAKCEWDQGACCEVATGVCQDVVHAACMHTFHEGFDCADLLPPCGNPGACCDDDSGICVDIVPELACAGRHAAGVLCSALDPSCRPCWDVLISAPGSWSGTTCGAGNDCALRASDEMIIKITIPTPANWEFSLCGGLVWDSYLYLGQECCAYVWFDNNGCGSSLSRIRRFQLPAGTYYATIEGLTTGYCGPFTLTVSTFVAEDPPDPGRAGKLSTMPDAGR